MGAHCSASRSNVVVEGVVVEVDEQQQQRRDGRRDSTLTSRLRRGLSGGGRARRTGDPSPPEPQQQRRPTLVIPGLWPPTARDAEERELFELFNTAIGYGLSNEDAVRRMIENYRAGNYSFDHYATLWRGRNADAARGVNAAADRLEAAPVRPGMAREATGLHLLATGVHLAREATGVHPWPAPAASNSAPVAEPVSYTHLTLPTKA